LTTCSGVDVLLVGLAVLCKPIVTVCGVAGAVYKPVVEMVPTVALPPTVLFTDQFTSGDALGVAGKKSA
jgi:hypothetical protein